MTTRTGRRLAGAMLALAVAGTVPVTAVGAAAEAPANGCPAGYQLLSVADLAALGYHVPTVMDDPASGAKSYGAPGNGDGFVCARPLGNQLTSFGEQLYNFMDNQLPAS